MAAEAGKDGGDIVIFSMSISLIRKGEIMKTTGCPACGGKIRIYHDHEAGDEVYCDDCERRFQLMGLDPIRLEPYEQYDDEYSDDGNFNDDYFDDDHFDDDRYGN